MCLLHVNAGLRYNTSLQELAIDNIEFDSLEYYVGWEDFFDATNNLKSLALLFTSKQFLTSLHYARMIPHVTNMLKRNQHMECLKVSFKSSVKVTHEDEWIDEWIQPIQQFWETVLLHPSLFYVCIHIPKLPIMRDVLNDIKKTLITCREQKKLGPPPLVILKNIIIMHHSTEEI